MATNGAKNDGVNKPDGDAKEIACGLVMPISPMDGCTAEHWSEVKSIVTEAVEGIATPSFRVRLVSDADEVGVIQKRIVQNLYTADVVVCDVSAKNPNVMFELGMRLAFDKPTIIIKDDKTDYIFDTGVIEHISYPRDLRFSRINTFKSSLADKVLATYLAAKDDDNHSTFLKNFGKFHVASLAQDVVPAEKLILEQLSDLQTEMSRLRRGLSTREPKVRLDSKVGRDALLATAFEMYKTQNPNCVLSELIDSAAFRQEMTHLIDAPSHFDSASEFRIALRDYLNRLRIDEMRRES